MGTGELAKALGISRQRVCELARKGKIARPADGQWDLARVRSELGGNLDATQASPANGTAATGTVGRRRKDLTATPGPEVESEPVENPEPPKGTLVHEQWRLTREKADREEIEKRKVLGELIDRDEARAAVTGMIAAAKQKLRIIPGELCDRLARTADPIACREMMAAKIDEALSALAEYPACA